MKYIKEYEKMEPMAFPSFKHKYKKGEYILVKTGETEEIFKIKFWNGYEYVCYDISNVRGGNNTLIEPKDIIRKIETEEAESLLATKKYNL